MSFFSISSVLNKNIDNFSFLSLLIESHSKNVKLSDE
jgi:hypothetical protein